MSKRYLQIFRGIFVPDFLDFIFIINAQYYNKPLNFINCTHDNTQVFAHFALRAYLKTTYAYYWVTFNTRGHFWKISQLYQFIIWWGFNITYFWFWGPPWVSPFANPNWSFNYLHQISNSGHNNFFQIVYSCKIKL